MNVTRIVKRKHGICRKLDKVFGVTRYLARWYRRAEAPPKQQTRGELTSSSDPTSKTSFPTVDPIKVMECSVKRLCQGLGSSYAALAGSYKHLPASQAGEKRRLSVFVHSCAFLLPCILSLLYNVSSVKPVCRQTHFQVCDRPFPPPLSFAKHLAVDSCIVFTFVSIEQSHAGLFRSIALILPLCLTHLARYSTRYSDSFDLWSI